MHYLVELPGQQDIDVGDPGINGCLHILGEAYRALHHLFDEGGDLLARLFALVIIAPNAGLGNDLFEELDRVALSNSEAIPVVRALQRRLLQLAGLRARVEQGQSVDAVMTSMGKSLFWKDKGLMQQLLSGWSAERLAAMLERSSALERTIIFSDEPPIAALEEELVTIARAAQRRR